MPADSIHVLLVEDDELHAGILEAALRSAAPGVTLHRCASLAGAIERLGSRPVDAVLLELDLPDSSGTDTVAHLHAQFPDMPIVVLTASDDAEAARAAVQHGAQDLLPRGEADGRLLSRALYYAIDRAAARAELVRREQYYRALIEQAYDMIVVLSPEGELMYQSPATERILGYPGAVLAGSNVLDLIHPDDRKRAAGVLKARPLPSGQDRMFHFRLRHRDGSWRVIEALGRPLHGDARQGIVVNARDVTERTQAEEQLRATEARLRQVHKMEAVGRLAGGIAHDFNNVLTAIYGYADLLMEAFDPQDPRRADVEEIRRSAERAAALTRQLLAFSRQQMLQPQVLNVNDVVQEVQRMLARLVGSDVQMQFEPSPDLRLVRADKGQIEQVLMNLGGNARDAMPEGGTLLMRTENRTVSAREAELYPGLAPGEYVCLIVADTGMGMPESVRRHIFEPFFTTKEQGQGTGLGLATVYGIVKQSGGGIYVDSEPGKGTTFTIYLPPHTVTSAP